MDSKIKELEQIIQEKDKKIHQLTLALQEEKLNLATELNAVHEYYENILAYMPGHVYWLDKNNIYLGCNDLQAKSAQLKSRKEIVGKTNYDMPWKDQAEELDRVNKLVMETGIPQTTEEYAVMANGMGIYYSQKVPLRNQKNEIIGVLGISLDITERKKMEVALRRAKENAEIANQAKTDFITNMSHDLRTPLSGIVGMSKLLELKAEDPERKQYARWIHESGEQLLELLNGVMEIIAADTLKEDDIYEELFELRKNIHDIALLVQPTLQMKNLQFNIEIDDAVPHCVITDGTKLHRVILNLLGNAIKFTESGSVTIKVEVLSLENNYAQLKFSIIDTGLGIPEEQQSKIFDRFYRAPCAYKGKNSGYGIGLHTAQKYLSLLGSEIHLKSEVGKGSTFCFILTMKINEEGSPTSYPEIAKSAATLQNDSASALPLVLLVESNFIALHMLETIMEDAGYPFYSAIDGAHALELTETNDFDLIITDATLPGIFNKSLPKCIREQEQQMKKKYTPIIGLATDISEESTRELPPEIDKILPKPVDFYTLKQTINELYQLERQNPVTRQT